jgi:hypothetical protein
LILITDGQVNEAEKTISAIVDASEGAPLSILCVGVGDGPWYLNE